MGWFVVLTEDEVPVQILSDCQALLGRAVADLSLDIVPALSWIVPDPDEPPDPAGRIWGAVDRRPSSRPVVQLDPTAANVAWVLLHELRHVWQERHGIGDAPDSVLENDADAWADSALSRLKA